MVLNQVLSPRLKNHFLIFPTVFKRFVRLIYRRRLVASSVGHHESIKLERLGTGEPLTFIVPKKVLLICNPQISFLCETKQSLTKMEDIRDS